MSCLLPCRKPTRGWSQPLGVDGSSDLRHRLQPNTLEGFTTRSVTIPASWLRCADWDLTDRVILRDLTVAETESTPSTRSAWPAASRATERRVITNSVDPATSPLPSTCRTMAFGCPGFQAQNSKMSPTATAARLIATVMVDPTSVANHSWTAPQNLGHLPLSSRNTVIQTRPTPTASTTTLTMLAGVVRAGGGAACSNARQSGSPKGLRAGIGLAVESGDGDVDRVTSTPVSSPTRSIRCWRTWSVTLRIGVG